MSSIVTGAEKIHLDPDKRLSVKGLVSVVIITFNRKVDLTECLHSLRAQDYGAVEIIVVDNGSTDGTADFLNHAFPGVRVICNEKNLGGCISRNQGISAARGEFVWFLDSDTKILDATFLSTLVDTMRGHPEVGVIGGEPVLDSKGDVVGVKRLLLLGNLMNRGEMLFDEPAGTLVDSDVIVTANFFTRREHLLAVGGFDLYYFFFAEDVDLTLAIRRLGFRTVVFCNTPVFHKFSPRGRVGRPRFPPRYFRNRTYMCFKYMGWRGLVLLPFRDLCFLCGWSNVVRSLRYLNKAREFGLQAAVRQMPASHQANHTKLGGLMRFLASTLSLPVFCWWLLSGILEGYLWFAYDIVKWAIFNNGRKKNGSDLTATARRCG